MSIKSEINKTYAAYGIGKLSPDLVKEFERQISDQIETKEKEINERKEKAIKEAKAKAKSDLESIKKNAVGKVVTLANLKKTVEGLQKNPDLKSKDNSEEKAGPTSVGPARSN